MEKYINIFVKQQLHAFPGSDETVLRFIAQVIYAQGTANSNAIQSLFEAGYCYYFALMLQHAFNRGLICNTGTSHFVWLDGVDPCKDIAYDICGVNSAYEVLIPATAMGELLYDFLHVPGLVHGTTKEEINEFINKWK